MAAAFSVTFRFTKPDDVTCFYGYESREYQTKAEAESYLQAVLARAILKNIHIIDWQIWQGSKIIAQF